MKLYKVTLQLQSPLVTPLKGDTIWGHVVWGIANHAGDEAVKSFLDECKSEEPSFIVSSAFPHNMLCRPMPPVPKREKNMTPDKYAQIKRSKKNIYVNSSLYINGNTKENDEGETKVFEIVDITHNTINRFSNTVNDGGLYAVSEQWSKRDLFDIYVISSYESSRVRQLCEWAFENGFGADASTGKGNISIIGNPEIVVPKNNTDTYMALAPFVLPQDSYISDLRADTFVRTGKLGGAFVSSMHPWKKTVILYNEGAVLKSEKPLQFIGNLLENVHSDSRICQSGFAPVIPISV
ncbi:MAG: CRISPR-associated protein Csm4 [Treponema sp.]|nr:CRISPR-associated protein Csm4 [Treponema sp.]